MTIMLSNSFLQLATVAASLLSSVQAAPLTL